MICTVSHSRPFLFSLFNTLLILFGLVQSLLPPVKKEDPYIPYYIAAASLAIFILLVIFCMLLNKRKHKQGFYFCADGKFALLSFL